MPVEYRWISVRIDRFFLRPMDRQPSEVRTRPATTLRRFFDVKTVLSSFIVSRGETMFRKSVRIASRMSVNWLGRSVDKKRSSAYLEYATWLAWQSSVTKQSKSNRIVLERIGELGAPIVNAPCLQTICRIVSISVSVRVGSCSAASRSRTNLTSLSFKEGKKSAKSILRR